MRYMKNYIMDHGIVTLFLLQHGAVKVNRLSNQLQQIWRHLQLAVKRFFNFIITSTDLY